ncbi:MAG: lipoprotein N-acyltransferase Lnb domain-containing protein [Paraglaciecola sp.]
MLPRILKGSILASFFLILTTNSIASEATRPSYLKVDRETLQQIANDPLWHLLLQLKNGRPITSDSSVYIANSFLSPLEEAQNTITHFQDNTENVCNYPARLRLIKRYVPEFESISPIQLCTEYRRFVESVPVDSIKLIYASENVTSASSMMGHIMLRLDGINDKGIPVKHGVTFFTALNSLNVPHIMYETLITGKEGVFKVAPYEEFEQFYLYEEQRNIWRYTLDFNEQQRSFVQDYIWELGQQSPAYFFHIFNCASVTQLLVNIARPNKLNETASWLTPLDVVKFAQSNSLVASTQFVPSNKWEITTLEEYIGGKRTSTISKHLAQGQLETLSLSFIETKYAQALNQYFRSAQTISEQRYQKNSAEIAAFDAKYKHLSLDVSEFPVPSTRQQEGYVGAGFTHQDSRSFMALRAFPVARRLADDNRSMIGETELILADFEFRVGLEQDNLGDIYVDKAMLYQMVSRVPVTQNVSNWSSSFNVGINRVLTGEQKRKLIVQSEFGLGFTREVTQGLGVYSDIIVGAGANKHEAFVYAKPVIGLYAYTKLNNKLAINLSRAYNQYGSNEPIDTASLSLHQYGFENIVLDFEVNIQKVANEYESTVSFMLGSRF